MDESQQVLNSVEYNIDNIIESAVDELLQQKVSSHSDYDDIDVLLLSLCRLCAREASQMIKISNVHWLLICDLKIPGIEETGACSTICNSCVRILEDIKQFRSLCEESQKRIIAMITQQNMLPDFLNLDFTDSKKDPTDVLISPLMNAQYNDGAIRDTIHYEHQVMESKEIEEKCADKMVQTNQDLSEPTPLTSENSSVQKHKRILPRKAALNVRKLVKSLADECDTEQSDSLTYDAYNPNGESDRQSSDESYIEQYQRDVPAVKKKPAKRKYKSKAAIVDKDKANISPKLESRRRMVDGRLEWVCLDCELVFESCFKLKKHRQNCELVGSERSKRFGSFPCEPCGIVLNTFAALCLHRYKHNTVGKDKKELKEKICHVCGKLFRSGKSLNKHIAIHDANGRKYKCHICDKTFTTKRYLRYHMEVHSNSKHECTICGKKFATSMVLRNHRETHKPNYLRQQCAICSKRFAHPYQLRKHMMIHTEEYPYSCEICSALFRKPCQLSRHMEKGHTPPEPPQREKLSEMIDFDDLIVYQPEDDLVAILDTIPEEMSQLPSVAVKDTLPQEQPFTSDQLLDEATREFTVQCFPDAHEADHEIYCFMEF